MYRSRLPAFSLVEMLVVMVLSTIIVGIIYFSFSTIQSYQSQLIRQKQAAEDFSTLYYIVKRDVQLSSIVRAPSNAVITCEYPEKQVEYSFFDNRVVRRQQERVDTFRLAFSPQLLRAGKLLSEFPAVVDEVRLATGTDSSGFNQLTVYKYYDAATLVPLTEIDSLP